MKAINIEWDIDENYEGDLDELQFLPDIMEVPNEMTDEEEISNWLSDVTGFCHKGFELVE